MSKDKKLTSLIFVLAIFPVLVFLILFPRYHEQIMQFTLVHTYVAPLILIVWRIIGVVIPPIPGGILSFALIPILGWFYSFVYAFIGVVTGASLAFLIARKFRTPFTKYFVPLQQLQTWEKQQSPKKEFLAFLLIRIATGPIVDFISYVAGMSKLPFRTFITATVIAEIPTILSYYVAGQIHTKIAEENIYLSSFIFIALIITLYICKDFRFKSK